MARKIQTYFRGYRYLSLLYAKHVPSTRTRLGYCGGLATSYPQRQLSMYSNYPYLSAGDSTGSEGPGFKSLNLSLSTLVALTLHGMSQNMPRCPRFGSENHFS